MKNASVSLGPVNADGADAGPWGAVGAAGAFGVLVRLKLRLLRNRLRQIADQSPLRLLLVIVFLLVIWGSLYAVFDFVFTFLRRFEQQAVIAIPLVFHVFVLAMTVLLAFSAAVLVYSAAFSRPEPAFLLASPHSPHQVVGILYAESLFFASWSLVLLGIPLMLAIGHAQNLPWHFYVTFVAAFLAFVPIPGALGLVAAMAVATWLPKMARRLLIYLASAVILVVLVWWIRLWNLASPDSNRWLQDFLGEMQYLKAALLPSTWVTQTIRFAIENRPADASFYLAVTSATALFFSYAGINLAARMMPVAYARARGAAGRDRTYDGRPSRLLTGFLFWYAPPRLRLLILKDVRNFLRDPAQWSQLLILCGLLALYLVYLPRTRPEGFSLQWQALICFLNNGAVTLILSTFTSRFVFPMISMEGRQIWLVGLWPMPRAGVLRAKFVYALTITGLAAAAVTLLSIRSLDLPAGLAVVQAGATFSACIGLCGLAVGLGARLPSYHESSGGRIASGLGGTVNLIASVGLVTLIVALVGLICLRCVSNNDLDRLDGPSMAIFAGVLAVGLGAAAAALSVGMRAFRRAEF